MFYFIRFLKIIIIIIICYHYSFPLFSMEILKLHYSKEYIIVYNIHYEKYQFVF